ncbi:VOC family protein [Streptosporangium sandarakinum]|uniref:VOC family protein n=1 Tax=Streptosporangium sandarakinum TaxID=1260955 RepID=UPI003678881F
MRIVRADHLVLTVRSIPASVDWYRTVLGMRPVVFGGGRVALAFGGQKLNLHQAGKELEPKAAAPTPGSADLCLISAVPLNEVQAHLRALAVPIETGPVTRTGATGPITSVYLRDPDRNLVEISTYDAGRPPIRTTATCSPYTPSTPTTSGWPRTPPLDTRASSSPRTPSPAASCDPRSGAADGRARPAGRARLSGHSTMIWWTALAGPAAASPDHIAR